MTFFSRFSRRLKRMRVVWWVCRDRDEAHSIYDRLCKVADIPAHGVVAEFSECESCPPDPIPYLRRRLPPGREAVGEFEPGSGPWYAAALLIPLERMGRFRPWYADAKYEYDLDDIYLTTQVSEYRIDYDMSFSKRYFAISRVIDSQEIPSSPVLASEHGHARSGPSETSCAHCDNPIQYGLRVMRHSSKHDLVVCEACVNKAVKAGKLPPEAAELEPFTD